MTSQKQSAFRRYRALLVLVPILALAAGGLYYLKRRAITLPESPIARVPRTASAIAHVNVAAVVASPLWERLVVARGLDAPLVQIRERCGFDPVSQIEVLTFFALGARPDGLDKVGVVAEGPFEHERLAECVRQALAAEGGTAGGGATMSQVEIDGVPAVASSTDESRAAFLGERGIAAGMLPTVRAVIATVRGDAESASDDPVLSRLWSTVAAGRDIVLVGHVPPNWEESLREAVGGERVAMITLAFSGLRSVGLGLRLSGGLGFGGMLVLENAERARTLSTLLTSQIETLKNNMMVSLTPLGPIVRSVEVEHRGTDVVITLNVPQERLDRLMAFADSLGGAPGAAPGAAPGQRPPGMPPGVAPAPTPAAPAVPPDAVITGMMN